MAYQTVLFCQDEKLARVLSQVFAEVDFTVDHAADAFSTVKKLMAQRYDAIVVDCDNEQNSTLVFKSARNSALNQNSLAIAVVEGQSGVARAYRMGASLVLTKPINVEHIKGTLRVARGLLRKNAEAATTGPGTAPVVSKPAGNSTTPVLPAAPVMPKTSPAPIAIVPAMAAPTSSPAAAAPAMSKKAAEPALQELPGAPMSKSKSPKTSAAESAVMTAASVSVATEDEGELDALNDVPTSTPAPGAVARPRPSSSTPPAKPSAGPKQSKDGDDDEMEFIFETPAGEPPLMSIYETADDAAKQAPNRGKIFMVVMTIFILLIAGYYAWSKYGPGSSAHPNPGSSAPQQKVPMANVERRITSESRFELASLGIPDSVLVRTSPLAG